MSLYNMVMGMNPMAMRWLAFLDTHPDVYGRFRDAWLEDKTGEVRIIVLTRCGGGNRQNYLDVFDEISKHPDYIEDYDSDYDSTYALFAFRVPEIGREWVNGLLEYVKKEEPNKFPIIVDNRTMKERFDSALKSIQPMEN